MEFKHISVLLEECIDALNIKPNGTYVDGTLGGAGHALYICNRLTKNATFIGIDQDNNAINISKQRLANVHPQIHIIKNNFSMVDEVLSQLGVTQIDGMLLDLGVSSHQIDESERGFSYMKDARLDMRMNQDSNFSAHDVINSYSEDELAKIIKDYAEEKWAARIAKFIVQARPIDTTLELVEVIKKAIPASARQANSHPAKRTFQAIRIEVNKEIDIIAPTIKKIVNSLSVGGRLCIITFHSLEDRIVKHTFKELQNPCTCPSSFPVCVCNKESNVKIITRKPVIPTQCELDINSRSQSAKLRAIEKI
ncbi:MAG: 16S rRNA (cytosine(1402)-N(4))-methyltransferase [Epulopiscium sp. Nuni2H_MBin003]|nr:MAG: 16S rRNA (cytosine(1402)-N(4))-methyltransferase [Epulopiscium sp. Nuni2H_MBin003]